MSTYLDFSIQTKADFKSWILRKLGEPLITVELTDEMIEDAINDSIEIFTEYVDQDIKYYAADLTEYIATSGVLLPDNTVGVFSIEESNVNGGINTLFSIENTMWNQGLFPNFNSGGGWLSYELAMQSVKFTRMMTGGGFSFDYSPRTKLLTLYPDPALQGLSGYIALGLRTIRPEEMQMGERIVKSLALAKCKIVLGDVRSKFEGIALLGGGSISSDIGNVGRDEEEKILEELRAENPAFGFFVG